MADYDYSVSGDTATGSVDFKALLTEAVDDPVVPFILGSSKLLVSGNLLRFTFAAALSGAEEAALDALVAAHPQAPSEDESAGATGYNFNRNPGITDDASIGIEVGDTWIANKNDVYVCLDNTPGAAQWAFTSQTGSVANESPGRVCLGSILNYPGAAGTGGSGDIQYARVWLVAGTVIDRMETFIASSGGSSKLIRMGIYTQALPENQNGVPAMRAAQTNAVATGPGLNGTYLAVPLTDAVTGGSGSPTTFSVTVTGYYWLAFVTNNTSVKFAVSSVFRKNFLPIRRGSGSGTTLPASASGLSNPTSAVVLVCTIKEGT